MIQLNYQDTATLYKVASSGYSNNKVVESEECVRGIFLQDTGFSRNNNQDGVISDARFFIDPTSDIVVDNHYRLEGMYLLAPLFDASDAQGWYKVTKTTINRDHLLGNQIDNVQLDLKKTDRLLTVS